MSETINNVAIENVSRILAELTTGTKISVMFQSLNYFDSDAIKYGRPFSTKWKRLNETIIHECKKAKNAKPFFKVIEYLMQPVNFMNRQEIWNENMQSINSVLIFYGYELSAKGKVIQIDAVETIADANKRLQSFINKLEVYDIHPEIMKFCSAELFDKNYFHAILEASKSLFERVRQLSESSSDGMKLLDYAFSTKKPVVLIKGNMLATDTERSLYRGLKSLLETITSLYRNPNAHTPKLYDVTSETDAITAFTLMSLAHRTLDNCINVRNINS
ncbi:TIGR02391 family protein [Marinilactibacillus psychrotolerans]|uniref:TIGR02391 family protein n=1 Tax=Marinilactibacillus psychrotolerans TaxID=191770 RepID=UPI00388AF024